MSYFVARFNGDGSMYNALAQSDLFGDGINTVDMGQRLSQFVADSHQEQITLLHGDSFDKAVAMADYVPKHKAEPTAFFDHEPEPEY